MADDAAKKTIGDYFTLQRGMTYKSALLGLPGPVLLGLASIERNGGFRSDSLKTYGGNSAEKLLLHPGDLYVSLKDVTQSADLLGAVSRVPDFCAVGRLTQDTVKLEPKLPDVPLSYLYWLLRTPQYRDYCRSHATGTTNLGLSREDFLAFTVPTPSCEQKRIVEILDALDDKIELNRRRNRTLESLARAIFQSWFVDFDPVRAKLDGRHPTGMDEATASLFPDTFTDSPLGPIPTGWRIGTLGDVATNPRRGIAAEAIPPGTPYIALEHMPRRSIAITEWASQESIASNKFGFREGEILFGKLRPYFHKVGVAPLDGVCSTDILVIVPTSPRWFGFATCHFASEAVVQHADQSSTGTKMPRTNWNDLARFQVTLPPPEVAGVFTSQFVPLIERIYEGATESRALAALRDSLLPKLISGELRVAEAEQIVEDVA